jgi:hypothetical protein
MLEICVYEDYYITLSLGVSNVMLRAFGNFRRALVSRSFLDLDVGGPVVTLEVKPAYGTQASEFGGPAIVQCGVNWQIGLEYLGIEVPLCLNTPIKNEEVVSFLTSPKLQKLKGDTKLLRSLEFSARMDVKFRSLEFANLII